MPVWRTPRSPGRRFASFSPSDLGLSMFSDVHVRPNKELEARHPIAGANFTVRRPENIAETAKRAILSDPERPNQRSHAEYRCGTWQCRIQLQHSKSIQSTHEGLPNTLNPASLRRQSRSSFFPSPSSQPTSSWKPRERRTIGNSARSSSHNHNFMLSWTGGHAWKIVVVRATASTFGHRWSRGWYIWSCSL